MQKPPIFFGDFQIVKKRFVAEVVGVVLNEREEDRACLPMEMINQGLFNYKSHKQLGSIKPVRRNTTKHKRGTKTLRLCRRHTMSS